MAVQTVHVLQILFFLMISEGKEDITLFQSPFIKQVKEGESVSINCEFSSTQHSIVGVYLKRNLSNPIDLIYIHQSGNTILDINRTEFKGNVKNFTITLKNLQESDTDIYYCVFGIRPPLSDKYGQGTVLLVSESNMKSCADGCAETRHCKEVSYKDPIVIGVIVSAIVAILCAIVLLFWRTRKVCRRKKSQPNRARAPNSVYEDMNLVRTQSMGR
ncbi:T-cell antigen CD7-like [Scyliorhinus canicula]|uniref:T-cell antigen CD7-like n=1 Tax=Scyliorhinus canicula TaxID=7830 RepID=UPI0018F72996|nr:T-cell antigen CD7-like [Scyliorhinus canicula]